MDIKHEIEIKQEELDTNQDYQQDSQSFPDNCKNFILPDNIENEEVDQKAVVKSELKEFEKVFVLEGERFNNEVIKSENFMSNVKCEKKLKRGLPDDIIAGSNFTNIGDNSDIEELSDDDDLVGAAESFSTLNVQNEETVPIIDFDENESFEIFRENSSQTHFSFNVKKGKGEKEKAISWVKDGFVCPPVENYKEFYCDEETKSPLAYCNGETKSPLEYFKNFFGDHIIEEFKEKSNRYFLQKNGKNLEVTNEEIRKLLGIHIEMGSMGLPQPRLYWSKSRRFGVVADSMTFNRFCVLRNNLHIVDNREHDPSSDDKFWKVRPVMNSFLNGIKLLEKEKRVCIDEQLIPFKGNLEIKKYMKGKPNPWGIKLFFICGESGIPYNFIAYQGKTTKIPEEYSNYGVGGSIVLSLVEETLEPFCGFRLFFDNFFTSSKLVDHLSDYEIYCTGTIRSNRISSNTPIKSDKEIAKQKRGTIDGCVSEDGRMSLARWNDNSVVSILSSAYPWRDNYSTVRRWDKSKREKVDIPCPPSILQYNQSMGGVDKLDYLLALYRIHIKSKKWTLRVIFHFVDLAVVTSWLLYKRDCKITGVAGKQQLTLLPFRMELVDSLLKFGSNPLMELKVERPSIQIKVGNDSRYDGIGHFPQWMDKRERCKKPKCAGKSYIICKKCNVSLCLNKDRNCFVTFHST